MKLLNYIKGNRKGKDAYRIERQAMDDPFLADALEGFESVDGNHARRIEFLQKKLTRKLQPKIDRIRIWSVAATILVCVSLGGYFIIRNIHRLDLFAVKEQKEESYPTVSEDITLVEDIALNDPVTDTLFVFIPEKKVRKVRIKEPEEQSPPVEVQMDKMPIAINTLSVIPVQAKNVPVASHEVIVTGYATREKSNSTDVSSQVSETKPSPLIGMKAYQKYIKKNMKYPTDSECGNKKGTVVLEFSVDSQGDPINIVIKKSICTGLDMEALRLLQQGPKWTKGTQTVELKVKF
ncbi:MAG: energy transducer TonB [Dysgonamonadaceae bacterium]|jgi:TonB family protein|nr:energy transducer TonB [Dysgonamonadaceae bacterium]